MLNVKKLLTKIMGTFRYKEISGSPFSYTTGTANTWTKHGNFTIPKDGLYRLVAAYNNSAVVGIGFSATSASSVVAATITENTYGAGVETAWWMKAGTYAFWSKCSSANKANVLRVYSVLVP